MTTSMKYRAVFIIIFLTAMMSFLPLNLITANGQDTKNAQPDEIAEQYVMPLLRALQKGDKDGMYINWVDGNQSKETDAYFDRLIGQWDRRVAVSVKRMGERKRPAEGKTPSGITYSYEAACSFDKVKVEITIADTSKKIDGINIYAIPKVTGTLSTWRQFNWAQWLMAGVAVLEILFTFFMAYRCVKRKPRFWGLWLALILMIYGGVVFSNVGGLGITFYIYTLAFPKILKFQDLGVQIYFSLPVGALVYYIRYSHGGNMGHSQGPGRGTYGIENADCAGSSNSRKK